MVENSKHGTSITFESEANICRKKKENDVRRDAEL